MARNWNTTEWDLFWSNNLLYWNDQPGVTNFVATAVLGIVFWTGIIKWTKWESQLLKKLAIKRGLWPWRSTRRTMAPTSWI